MELFTWFEIIKCRKKKKIPRPAHHSSLMRAERPRLRSAKVIVVWLRILTGGKALGTQLPGHTEAQYSSFQFSPLD